MPDQSEVCQRQLEHPEKDDHQHRAERTRQKGPRTQNVQRYR